VAQLLSFALTPVRRRSVDGGAHPAIRLSFVLCPSILKILPLSVNLVRGFGVALLCVVTNMQELKVTPSFGFLAAAILSLFSYGPTEV
jgi:hypothetical protein